MPLSGANWFALFPTGNSITDLDSAFQKKAQEFADALVAAGADINITASRRPRQRAYLMHYSWSIWKHLQNPASVPAFKPRAHEAAVDIEWLHRTPSGDPDIVASRAAAFEMVKAYEMVDLNVAPAS